VAVPELGVGLIGSKFMGRAHSNAWMSAHRFFDLTSTPAMRAVAATNADDLAEFAPRWGWERATT
jgi:predicted dehydrogenase